MQALTWCWFQSPLKTGTLMSSNWLFMEGFLVTNGEQVISDSSQTQLKGLWFSEIEPLHSCDTPLSLRPALALAH